MWLVALLSGKRSQPNRGGESQWGKRWENRTDGAQEGRRRWCNSWAGKPDMNKILVCSLYTGPWRQTMWLVIPPVSAQTCTHVMQCNDCCFSAGELLPRSVSLSCLTGIGSNWVTMDPTGLQLPVKMSGPVYTNTHLDGMKMGNTEELFLRISFIVHSTSAAH